MDPDSVIDDKLSQESENSSGQSSDFSSSSSSAESISFTVVLRQKPRGSGGIWQAVQSNEHLRVSDKRAGKNLRLVLTSQQSQPQNEIDWSPVEVTLLSKPTRVTNSNIAVADVWKEHGESNDAFKISTRKSFVTGLESSRRSVCQIDLKLFLMYRTIKFRVTLGDVQAESLTFISYNSGTEETNRQTKAAKGSTSTKKRKRDGQKKPTPPTERQSSSAPPRSVSDPKPDQDKPGSTAVAETIQSELDATWTVIDRNLEVDGIVRAQKIIQLSDVRLKVDVTQLTDALHVVSLLDGKSYQWRADKAYDLNKKYAANKNTKKSSQNPGERVLGFIAQEVQRVCPEIVQEDPVTGMLSISYAELVPVLIEALKTIRADQDQFESQVEENLKQLAEMREEFMSASKQIRSTLRRIGKIRESRPLSPPAPTKHNKLKRSVQSFCSRRVCGVSLSNISLALGLIGSFVAIILVAALAGSNNQPPQLSITPDSPPSMRKIPWSTRNWFNGGGFEPYEGEPTNVVGQALEFHKYSNFTEFPEVNNASLYFNAGETAARIFIDPALGGGTWEPVNILFGIPLQDVLLNFTGFSNSSSGVIGLNISGWFNWIYAEEPLGYPFFGRTTERIYLQVNAFFPGNDFTYPDKTDLYFAPNILPGAYRGWTQMQFFYRFEEERYPQFVNFAFTSTMLGSVFFDDLQGVFVLSTPPA